MTAPPDSRCLIQYRICHDIIAEVGFTSLVEGNFMLRPGIDTRNLVAQAYTQMTLKKVES